MRRCIEMAHFGNFLKGTDYKVIEEGKKTPGMILRIETGHGL